jgi:hypothetical protein
VTACLRDLLDGARQVFDELLILAPRRVAIDVRPAVAATAEVENPTIKTVAREKRREPAARCRVEDAAVLDRAVDHQDGRAVPVRDDTPQVECPDLRDGEVTGALGYIGQRHGSRIPVPQCGVEVVASYRPRLLEW